MIERDDRLLKHGLMRDARGEYLTLRLLVLGPEEGVRGREEESEKRRGRGTERVTGRLTGRDTMQAKGMNVSMSMSVSLNKRGTAGGGRRGTREERERDQSLR